MKRPALVVLPWVAALGLRVWSAHAPQQVETVYSRGLYPWVATVLATVSRGAPFSLAELLCAALAVVAGWLLVRARRRARREGTLAPALRRSALGLVAASGALYLTFLLVWGLNYSRLPLASVLGLDAAASPVAELALLTEELVAGANAGREGLPEDGAGVVRLSGDRAGLARVRDGFDALGSRLPLFPGGEGRVKVPVTSPLLAYLGVAGLYVPFTAEPHVNGTLPDSELPFTASHEFAHQQGFAREDEANYVGYLACLRHPDPVFRYSAELRASLFAVAALHGPDPEQARRIASRRSPAVRRDLAALQAWHVRYASRAGEVQRRVNDAYLKTQGQALGVRSYGRMIDLLLAERRRAASQVAP